MAIKFCNEESATIFSRKQIKKLASEHGMILGKDFEKKKVNGGWIAFSEIVQTRKDVFGMRWPTVQTFFWCT